MNVKQSKAAKAPPPSGENALLEVRHAKLGYEVGGSTLVAVGDVSFEVYPGEKVMLLGPSGCGKSTLLKCVAGFLSLIDGDVSFSGRPTPEPGPDRAVVFQEFDQLFPWFTVKKNIVYPQIAVGRSKADADPRADEYLELMSLSQAADRYPHQLSGGMKQRVAIARALAMDPDLLLMDEPFGALDAQTRARLQVELNDVVEKTSVTVLFVTHSIQEAVYLGDRVVVLGQPPSSVVDVIDVKGLTNPDDPAFDKALHRLRNLLTGDEPDSTNFAFE